MSNLSIASLTLPQATMSMFNKGGNGQPKGFGFGGFAIQPKRPGPESQLAQMGYGMMGSHGMLGGQSGTSKGGYTSNIGKRRVKSEEEWVSENQKAFTACSTLQGTLTLSSI